jgi:hypothetical protein
MVFEVRNGVFGVRNGVFGIRIGFFRGPVWPYGDLGFHPKIPKIHPKMRGKPWKLVLARFFLQKSGPPRLPRFCAPFLGFSYPKITKIREKVSPTPFLPEKLVPTPILGVKSRSPYGHTGIPGNPGFRGENPVWRVKNPIRTLKNPISRIPRKRWISGTFWTFRIPPKIGVKTRVQISRDFVKNQKKIYFLEGQIHPLGRGIGNWRVPMTLLSVIPRRGGCVRLDIVTKDRALTERSM